MSSTTLLDEINSNNPEALIFPYGNIEILKKVIEALNFKGGEASLNSLKIATMLEDDELKEGLHSGFVLNLLENDPQNPDLYIMTRLADQWLSETKASKQAIIAENLLNIDPILDIIYRMKASPDKTIKIGEIESALYIILSNTREEIRKVILRSFINFGEYGNLFESIDDKSNPRLKITTAGEKAFDAFRQKKKAQRKKSTSQGSGVAPSTVSESDLQCSECGKPIHADYAFCPYCTTPLKRSCSNCGKELQPGWKMCPFCGSSN